MKPAEGGKDFGLCEVQLWPIVGFNFGSACAVEKSGGPKGVLDGLEIIERNTEAGTCRKGGSWLFRRGKVA
jgi:hypothetical protein